MDTVFPADTAFTEFTLDGSRAVGPGVIDMKGGLTVGIFALGALHELGLLKTLPVAFLFNSDEEVGSPTSGALIRQEAVKSAFAFVLEAGGLDGQVVTARKGNLSAVLTVKGRAGHAAFAGPEKASAVLELAHRIVAVEALNRPEQGITANVGRIEGGLGPNTVPDRAEARIDVRFETPEDGEQIFRRLQRAAECGLNGTSCRLSIRSQRPPMPECEANRRLYATLVDTAAALKQRIVPELRPGVSDANLIADEKIPVLDGLGPIGARDHSPEEYMLRESLLDRAVLVACGLIDCREAVREADRSR
jgi:glutamate carboxypeptidase